MRSKILLLFAFCVFGVTPAAFAEYGAAITVNCGLGQSLNATLSKLPKLLPITVFVKGTCTEYVSINGFTGLTLKGLPGAALQQPSTSPGNGVPIYVVLIQASQSITIDGFAVHSGPSAIGGIAIGRNSTDVQLRNLTMDGGASFGFFIYEESQVSLARVTTNNLGYAVLGAFDVSDVHIESSLFTDGLAGIVVETGHVTIQTTSIRNMKIGISVTTGDVDIQSFSSYYPLSLPTDVVIDNSSHRAVEIMSGAHLNLGDTKLRITNAGQFYDSYSAAIWMTDASSLNDPNGHLSITGSQGQGILVSNNSHATLTGSSITGGSRGGLVVSNLSTASIGLLGSQTLVGGNATDVFCDSRSLITGGGNLAGTPITKCSNLLSGDTEPLP